MFRTGTIEYLYPTGHAAGSPQSRLAKELLSLELKEFRHGASDSERGRHAAVEQRSSRQDPQLSGLSAPSVKALETQRTHVDGELLTGHDFRDQLAGHGAELDAVHVVTRRDDEVVVGRRAADDRHAVRSQ